MGKLLLIFLILITFGNVYSQTTSIRKLDFTREDGNTPNVIFMDKAVNTNHSSMVDPVGTIPGLTGFYDYVTNGNNIRKLWVIGDTILATVDQTDSANAQTSAARRSYYQVSFDGGATWMPDALIVSNAGNAYPDMTPIFLSGQRTIAVTGRQFEGATRRGYAGVELGLTYGSFTITLNPSPGSDMFSYLLSSSQLACAYAFHNSDTLNFIKFNYTNNTYGTRTVIASPTAETDVNARWYIAANIAGTNIFVMWWVSTSGAVRMVGRESTNGGTSFGSIVTVLPFSFVVNGDQVSSWFGADVIYKPGTNTVCAAMNTLAPGNFATAQGTKLLFWSPAVNSGNPVNIADRTNMPTLMDTSTWNNSTASLQVGMTGVSHPSLAYSSDGSRLVCVFSGAQPDTSSYNFRFNDIWSSYSDNNGAAWSAPVRLTNTPAVDEIYVSISKTGNTPTNVGVTYSVSDCPGATSFTNTGTPICRVYQVYRRYNPVTGQPIGIENISGEIPKQFSLKQNYPNPFNPSTRIRFELPHKSIITLKIYDILGREVAVLLENDNATAGTKEIAFNADNLTSGVYFYKLITGEFTATKKMILLK